MSLARVRCLIAEREESLGWAQAMNESDHVLFIVAAYAVTVVLLLAEVWLLVRRSRAHAAIASQEPDDEA